MEQTILMVQSVILYTLYGGTSRKYFLFLRLRAVINKHNLTALLIARNTIFQDMLYSFFLKFFFVSFSFNLMQSFLAGFLQFTVFCIFHLNYNADFFVLTSHKNITVA